MQPDTRERIISIVITTAEILRILAICLGLAAIVVFIIAIFVSQRSGKAAYYSMRREARTKANRTLAAAFILGVIAIGISITGLFLPAQHPSAPPIIAVNMTSTPAMHPTIYIVPTSTPPSTATPAPSSTPPPATPRAIIVTKSATPAGDKILTLRAISSQIDALGQPISPTMEFTKGVASVYVMFDYTNVPNGALVRHTWYRDGNSMHFDSLTWMREGAGAAYIVWSPGKGFEAGLYEVRVMLANTRQFSANFVVR